MFGLGLKFKATNFLNSWFKLYLYHPPQALRFWLHIIYNICIIQSNSKLILILILKVWLVQTLFSLQSWSVSEPSYNHDNFYMVLTPSLQLTKYEVKSNKHPRKLCQPSFMLHYICYNVTLYKSMFNNWYIIVHINHSNWKVALNET